MNRKGIPLRNDRCLEIFEEHKKKPSHYAPEPCQCPWCRKARSLKRTVPLEV